MRFSTPAALTTLFLTTLLFSGCGAPGRGELTLDTNPLRAIAQLEDARTPGKRGELERFLGDPDPAVRARAATAAGRLRAPIGGGPLTALVAVLLDDAHESVRAAAAFALGMRGDADAYDTLILHGIGARADAAPRVRAVCVEAASKLAEDSGAVGDPARVARFLEALADADPAVRLEAFAGPARWKRGDTADLIDGRLAAAVAAESDVRTRTYGLFALERRKASAGRLAFLACSGASDAEERLFAVRGLAAIPGDAEVEAALMHASLDADWRIAVEALRGLARSSSRPALEAMIAATHHASPHVRAVAIESAGGQAAALGGLLRIDRALAQSFQSLMGDLSPAVRAAAVANPSISNALIARTQSSGDISPHVRAAALRAHAKFTAGGGANPLALSQASPMSANESSLLVRGAQIEALASLPPEQAALELTGRLSLEDNGLRLAALTTLLELPEARVPIADVERCYQTARGEVGSEVRFNALRLAAKLATKLVLAGGDADRAAARALLERARGDEDAYVRHVAREELARLTGTPLEEAPEPLPAVELAFAGEGLLAEVRPRVVISTDRGDMEFVLFGDEAPQHVANFLHHLERYRGTTFHRVVPDFVVQGGDARGDGNGGSSWRGDALRHEIGPRKYVRGSLGMPRNEDWDSGGSQIFVTHRATPHLDGRYTIFGELVSGDEVLDRLDLGDVIREVRPVVVGR